MVKKTTATKKGKRETKKLAPQELEVLPGFEEVAPAWWAAVKEVHELLLKEDAEFEAVSEAFHKELLARWEYAKALHERGYVVPDYLAEKAPIAPLWPLPEVPVRRKPMKAITRAA